jgi:tetratricopeptide (TPR) repeat protein
MRSWILLVPLIVGLASCDGTAPLVAQAQETELASEEPGPAFKLAKEIALEFPLTKRLVLDILTERYGDVAALDHPELLEPRDWVIIASSLSKDGRHKHALRALELAEQEGAKPPMFHLRIEVLLGAGRHDEAHQALKETLPLPPPKAPTPDFHNRDWQAVERFYAWLVFAEHEAAAGRAKEAETAFQNALTLARSNPQALESLGAARVVTRYSQLQRVVPSMVKAGFADWVREVLDAEERLARALPAGRPRAETLAAIGSLRIEVDEDRAGKLLLEALTLAQQPPTPDAVVPGRERQGAYGSIARDLYRVGRVEKAIEAALTLPASGLSGSNSDDLARAMARQNDTRGLTALREAIANQSAEQALRDLAVTAAMLMARSRNPEANLDGPYTRQAEPFLVAALALARTVDNDSFGLHLLNSVLIREGRLEQARELALARYAMSRTSGTSLHADLARIGEIEKALEVNPAEARSSRRDYNLYLLSQPDRREEGLKLARELGEEQFFDRNVFEALASHDFRLAVELLRSPGSAWSLHQFVQRLEPSRERAMALVERARAFEGRQERAWLILAGLSMATKLPLAEQETVVAKARALL